MLTNKQKKRLREAIGDGTDWPKFTDDPQVNYEIDKKVEGVKGLDWEQLSQEQRDVYIDETNILKA